MKLVIAEKPVLARDIARAMCGIEVADDAHLPLSGNGYTVCACAGHLLELCAPDETWFSSSRVRSKSAAAAE